MDGFVNEGTVRRALALVDLVCLVVFAYDLCRVWAWILKQEHNLQAMDALACCRKRSLVVLLHCRLHDLRLTLRSLFPFFMISRRGNLKLMMQGLMHSAYYTRPVLQALTELIVLWGFLGFFLFRNLKDPRASSKRWQRHQYGLAPLYVPPSLNAMQSLYDSEVLYCLLCDLDLSDRCALHSFVIAVGNRQYKQFASRVLRKRLLDRKKAVSLVYFAFAKLKPEQEDDDMGMDTGLDGDY